MADTKISALTELTVPPDLTDEFVLVDKSDTTMAASGTDKRIKSQTLIDRTAALSMSGMPPTGITYANFNRYEVNATVTAARTSLTLYMHAIWLPAGFTVTSISAVAGTTGLTTSGTSPHFWFALYNSALGLLGQSTDITNATWTLSTIKTLNLAPAFATTYTGLHYIGIMVGCGNTGTMPTFAGTNVTSTGVTGLAPILMATSTTGCTGTAPSTAAALTAIAGQGYVGVA
jgi:hypothetical protein